MTDDEFNEKLLEREKARREKIVKGTTVMKQNVYYLLIFSVSLIAAGVLPFFESTMTGKWNAPTSPWGWVLYVSSKLITATLNLLIFHAFMQQAKLNVRNDPNYIRAREILAPLHRRQYVPKSPHKWNTEQYSKKGVTIFVSSLLALITIGDMILRFSWPTFIATIITVVIGIVVGVMQMMSAMDYWTNEFLDYALYIQKQMEPNKEDTEENA